MRLVMKAVVKEALDYIILVLVISGTLQHTGSSSAF